MSFENLIKNLQTYEEKEVSLNVMYELIDFLIGDVLEHNRRLFGKQDSISEMKVNHSGDQVVVLFDCVSRLLNNTVDVIEKDAKLLDDEMWEKDLDMSSKKAKEMEQHIDELGKKIGIENEKKEETEKKQKESTDKLNKIRAEVEELSDKISETKKSIEVKLKEKEDYEKILEQLYIENGSVSEIEAKYAVLLTAFNSLLSEEKNISNIFDEGKEIPIACVKSELSTSMKAESISDIRKWCDSVEKRIEELISVYQEAMKRLMQASEKAQGEE